MRQIKFRGMDVNGVMRYGQLSQDKPDLTAYYEKCSQRICWDNSNIPVTNESLGQFTGLTDKNGKEIYEGDLIECYTKSGEKVYTYPHEVKLPDFYREIWSHDLESGLPAELGEKTVVLVVGNKFENPELLNN